MVTVGRFDPNVASEFRQLLQNARGQLLRRVLVTEDEMHGLADHEPGTLVEDSSRAVMADLLERIDGRERHELDEIQAAQARLESGTFGTCEACRRPVPLSRLRALPWTRHCLGCQTEEEGR
jgi:RNA polymerase-binding transcription factor DksA